MILENIFSGTLYDKFLINPAGMRLHHAYIGGLLQHSVDVAGIAQSLADRIGGVDKDLIVAGALLHDIGKIREISSDIGFPYTMEGRLLGHVSMSAVMVQDLSCSSCCILFYHTMVNRKKVRRLHVQRKKALLCIMLMKLMRL